MYVYNWVHFWFLLFPEQLLYPILHIYFQHYPWCFYYFLNAFISYWVHLFDIIFYLKLYVCIFFTNQLHYVTLVHIQWCMVYVIYIAYIYIWDIYLSMNCYWLIHFTICYYCHSQNNTRVHNWYMSWSAYNRYSVI